MSDWKSIIEENQKLKSNTARMIHLKEHIEMLKEKTKYNKVFERIKERRRLVKSDTKSSRSGLDPGFLSDSDLSKSDLNKIKYDIKALERCLNELENEEIGDRQPQPGLSHNPPEKTPRKFNWIGENQDQLVALFKMLHGINCIDDKTWEYLPSLLRDCFTYKSNELSYGRFKNLKSEWSKTIDLKKDNIMSELIQKFREYDDPPID